MNPLTAVTALVRRLHKPARQWQPFEDAACESCSNTAYIRLTDGSTWCLSCDWKTRNHGYDNQKATLL